MLLTADKGVDDIPTKLSTGFDYVDDILGMLFTLTADMGMEDI